MKKIITVIGARPQFVKAAVVSRIVRQREDVREVLVHTGQHFDKNMSEVFFEEMEIPMPDYQLDINGLTHGKMTGRMLEAIEEILLKEKPDLVLVYGDTNSTLAGALVAAKIHIPIAHVEAGLRSYNMQMPEEINRILTDRVSKWLFCPTDTAVNNLKREGFSNFESSIYLTGDVMLDCANFYASKLDTIPSRIEISEAPFVLATLHREENTKPEKLRDIISILNAINEETVVIMPIHPGTRRKLHQNNVHPKFKMIDPVGYFDMIRLLKDCLYVVTDSGGLQKEAFFFHKYCVTLREQTEWVELVENGVNFICGSNQGKVEEAIRVIKNRTFPTRMSLYGDGNAGINIVTALFEKAR